MAIAVDGATPVRWNFSLSNVTITPSNGNISASFTAPANALLVACLNTDGADDAAWDTVPSVSDSGGLTWTKRVERTWSETTAGGESAIWTARTTSSTSRTITIAGDTANISLRVSTKCYVLTGVDVDGTPVDTVTGSNEGGSATNNLTTTSVTPGADGLLLVCDTDWNELGAFEASSNLTQDTEDYPGEISVCSGYRTCTSGVGVTANLNAGGSGTAQHKWCQIVVRAATGGGPVVALEWKQPSAQPTDHYRTEIGNY